MLTVPDNSRVYCEDYCLPCHQCGNGLRDIFFQQLLLSLNMNIYSQNKEETKNIYAKQDNVVCVKQNIVMCFHAYQLQKIALIIHQKRSIVCFVQDQMCSQEKMHWVP